MFFTIWTYYENAVVVNCACKTTLYVSDKSKECRVVSLLILFDMFVPFDLVLTAEQCPKLVISAFSFCVVLLKLSL